MIYKTALKMVDEDREEEQYQHGCPARGGLKRTRQVLADSDDVSVAIDRQCQAGACRSAKEDGNFHLTVRSCT